VVLAATPYTLVPKGSAPWAQRPLGTQGTRTGFTGFSILTSKGACTPTGTPPTYATPFPCRAPSVGGHRRVDTGPEASGQAGPGLGGDARHRGPPAWRGQGAALQRGALLEVSATAAAGRGSPAPSARPRAQHPSAGCVLAGSTRRLRRWTRGAARPWTRCSPGCPGTRTTSSSTEVRAEEAGWGGSLLVIPPLLGSPALVMGQILSKKENALGD
jgi:hypothetical protein